MVRRAPPSSWSRLLPACGGFSCCGARAPGVRARWLQLLGSGAQARGLWRGSAALVCGVLPAQLSSRVSCTCRQILDRRATRDAPCLQLLAQQTALAPYAFNRCVCVCLHSLIHIHQNSLGTLCPGPVPGVAVYGASEDPAELVSTSHPPSRYLTFI